MSIEAGGAFSGKLESIDGLKLNYICLFDYLFISS